MTRYQMFNRKEPTTKRQTDPVMQLLDEVNFQKSTFSKPIKSC